ncbi:Ubiquitin_carboxyl-terminal hydrolase family protein [Hexamita inflata]|uniref:Ubiquitin_carboxyl-terminal hydrolase family protein n=1 Tax=Hexamita inflata TaxID=28002 RepID=A0ABP1HC89_9EUKA
MKKNLSGLQNNGATCYLNATLQGLFNCDSARSAFLNGPNVVELLEKIEASGEHEAFTSDDQSVVSALQLLFTQMQSSIQSSLSTKKFCKSLGMTENDMRQQEDANELMKKILDKLDFASKKFDNQTGQRTHALYQKTFEGETDSVIKCTHCQNESVTKTPFTDLMLPVRKDFFHSLASMVLPEQLDGYRCENCGNTTQALRYVAVNRIPDLGCMTLQRFVMDMYGNMNKDSSPVEFPLYVDLEFVRYCNVREIGFGSSEDEMAQLFHVLLMPWLFFEVEGEKVSAKSPIASGLLENPDFVQHLVRYYQDAALMVPFANEDLPDMFLAPQFKVSPPNLFALRTIVCHSGNMNYGHYYTLALKPSDAGTVMQKCNDSYVSKIEKPANMLQFISGLTKELADEGKEKELSKSMQNYKPTAGYGNTGYMYLFERCGDYPAAPVLSERVEAAILKENRDTEDQIFKKQVVVYSNYKPQDMDAFADSKSAEFQFDIRNTAANLVDLAKQQLNIPVDFQYINIFIHSLKMFGDKPENNREKYLVETPAQLNLSLDELLDTGYRPRTFKLLIEFVPNDTYEPFNYQKKYFRFQQVKATEDDRLFETTVIGYNTRLEHLSSFSAGLDRTALLLEAKSLYTLPADYCSRFVADSQLDLVVIKSYLALKWKINPSQISVFVNSFGTGLMLANMQNARVSKTDIDCVLYVQQNETIFFEIHEQNSLIVEKMKEELVDLIILDTKQTEVKNGRVSKQVPLKTIIDQLQQEIQIVEQQGWYSQVYNKVAWEENETVQNVIDRQKNKDKITVQMILNTKITIFVNKNGTNHQYNIENDTNMIIFCRNNLRVPGKNHVLKINGNTLGLEYGQMTMGDIVTQYQCNQFVCEEIIDEVSITVKIYKDNAKIEENTIAVLAGTSVQQLIAKYKIPDNYQIFQQINNKLVKIEANTVISQTSKIIFHNVTQMFENYIKCTGITEICGWVQFKLAEKYYALPYDNQTTIEKVLIFFDSQGLTGISISNYSNLQQFINQLPCNLNLVTSTKYITVFTNKFETLNNSRKIMLEAKSDQTLLGLLLENKFDPNKIIVFSFFENQIESEIETLNQKVDLEQQILVDVKSEYYEKLIEYIDEYNLSKGRFFTFRIENRYHRLQIGEGMSVQQIIEFFQTILGNEVKIVGQNDNIIYTFDEASNFDYFIVK